MTGAQPRAAVIYVHPGEVSAAFAFSMMRLLVAEQAAHGMAPAVIAQRVGSGQLVDARNETVEFFLESPVEWALFVDSDMGFGHDTLGRLIESAAEDRVVGALCFGLKKHGEDAETQAVTLRCFPTLYTWRELEDQVGWQVMTDYPRDALVQVGATGAACFVVHRTILEKIRDKYGPVWFDQITHPVGPTKFSEDLSFFVRVAGVDAMTFVDTGTKTSHDKGGVFLTEERWDEQQKATVGAC